MMTMKQAIGVKLLVGVLLLNEAAAKKLQVGQTYTVFTHDGLPKCLQTELPLGTKLTVEQFFNDDTGVSYKLNNSPTMKETSFKEALEKCCTDKVNWYDVYDDKDGKTHHYTTLPAPPTGTPNGNIALATAKKEDKSNGSKLTLKGSDVPVGKKCKQTVTSAGAKTSNKRLFFWEEEIRTLKYRSAGMFIRRIKGGINLAYVKTLKKCSETKCEIIMLDGKKYEIEGETAIEIANFLKKKLLRPEQVDQESFVHATSTLHHVNLKKSASNPTDYEFADRRRRLVERLQGF